MSILHNQHRLYMHRSLELLQYIHMESNQSNLYEEYKNLFCVRSHVECVYETVMTGTLH